MKAFSIVFPPKQEFFVHIYSHFFIFIKLSYHKGTFLVQKDAIFIEN